MQLSSTWEELRAMYDKMVAAPLVNVREMFRGAYLEELLPLRGIEVSQEEFTILRELCVVEVDIGFKVHHARRYDFKATMNLLPFSFTEIDDRVFVSFPDDVWDLTMALIGEFIALGELAQKIEEGSV